MTTVGSLKLGMKGQTIMQMVECAQMLEMVDEAQGVLAQLFHL